MTEYDDMDWDGILGDSNGPAFQKNEERFGPPLDYVAEKSRRSLEELHALHKAIEALMSGGPRSAAGTSEGLQAAASAGPAASQLPDLLARAKGSFHSSLDYMSPVEYERRNESQVEERKPATVHETG